ncbi:MAG: M16 family metallopeptidase [Alphaproteobacteria bacterium]
MTNIKTTTLSNGLRVITDHVPSMHSVALGVWAGVGAQFERAENNGTAHMLEHMMFKGTAKRNAMEIAESIESVGGSMNAYTSREITSYHIHLLHEHMPLALETIADMYQNSTLPMEEVERERQVILQEIGMCHDTPDDLIFDQYYEAAYPDQAFGAPILGTVPIIEGMPRETLFDFMKTHYTPKRSVISAAGNVDHDAFVALVEAHFNALPDDVEASAGNADYKGGERRTDKDLEQAHFILGFPSVGRTSPDFYTAQALSTLFGGGMSSRLFQEVREKRGLVYSIFSFNAAHQDGGQFGIYAGTGAESLPEIMPVICDEIGKVTQNVSEAEVERAKAQLKSSLLMGRESMMTRADQHARHLLFRDAVFDIDAVIAQVDEVCAARIKTVAKDIFSTKPTLAALGPLGGLEGYDALTARLAA